MEKGQAGTLYNVKLKHENRKSDFCHEADLFVLP